MKKMILIALIAFTTSSFADYETEAGGIYAEADKVVEANEELNPELKQDIRLLLKISKPKTKFIDPKATSDMKRQLQTIKTSLFLDLARECYTTSKVPNIYLDNSDFCIQYRSRAARNLAKRVEEILDGRARAARLEEALRRLRTNKRIFID